MSNLHILVEAKIEYTKTLINILSNSLLEGFQSIYDDSKSFCEKNRNSKYLIRFQHNLSEIPKWNQSIISDEYTRIITKSNCEWLDDLITAVFISHAKVLTSIKENDTSKSLNLKIPKAEHFIHKCYIECARIFWKNPYLFYDKVSNIDIQKNLRDAENIISNTIEETVRKLLPVKTILQEYLGNNFEDDDFDKEDIENLLSNNQKNNVQKMVKKDIDSIFNTKSETKEPETIEPETKESETKESETKEPETKESEIKEPETIEPETKEPETIEPETKEPETIQSETKDSEIKEPETIEPETIQSETKETKKNSEDIKLDLSNELLINNDISELDISEFDKIESDNLTINDLNEEIINNEKLNTIPINNNSNNDIITIDDINVDKKDIIIDDKKPKIKKIKNVNIKKIDPINFYIE